MSTPERSRKSLNRSRALARITSLPPDADAFTVLSVTPKPCQKNAAPRVSFKPRSMLPIG